MKKIKVALSILSADFGKLNAEIVNLESYIDMVHVDVMDGHFVPNLSLGVPVVESIRCKKPLDIHLMIEHPEKYLEVFAKATEKAVGKSLKKKSYLVFHVETVKNPMDVIKQIHALDMLAGIALNPDTFLKFLHAKIIHAADMILCMAVYPGFGGQKFIAGVLPKIRALRDLCPDVDIEVDGGINNETVHSALEVGANVIVAGSYVFGAKNRKMALASLKAAV